jgi:hypothetical protein
VKHVWTLVLALGLCFGACRTAPPVTGMKRVSTETTRDLRVAGGSREIEVEVREKDTVFHFGDASLICRDYRGYLGDFAAHRGWARVGKLELSWQDNSLRVRSRKGWAMVQLDSKTRVFATQDGEMGRSIFR